MICLIALFVFGVLGIFSAKYRIIAKEAFDCVFRKLTLRRCDSRLDSRLKAQITGKLMRKHQLIGRWIYRRFEILSWFFTILLLLSLFFTGQAVYNYAVYGNCNGPESTGFCIFDPLNTIGGNSEQSTNVCPVPGLENERNLSFNGTIINKPFLGNENASIVIVEFGCFACPNTKKAVFEVKKLIKNYGEEVKLVYLDFPIPTHKFSYEASLAANCVWINNPELYWDYNFKIFDNQKKLSPELLRNLAVNVGANVNTFDKCIANNESKQLVDENYQSGLDFNVYGTPIFFINDKPYVGVTSYKKFKEAIETELKS